jgi:hypothetical protein
MSIISFDTTNGYSKSGHTSLLAPTIPVALSDGLLPITAVSHPVTVHLKVWADARVADTYQLLWDNVLTGLPKSITDTERPGDLLFLEVLPIDLVSGPHELAYQVRNPANGAKANSPAAYVEIDLTAPGNPLIAPIIFPISVQDGLTSTELEELGDVLEGIVPSYNDMKEGDVIRTYWGSIEGPTVAVDKDDMGLKKVVVQFTRDFLLTIGDIEVAVHYTVTDRAGNLSMDSEPSTVKLLLSVITPLPVPRVKEANDDGTLDPIDTASGVTVLIDTVANFKQGDVVSVSFQGPKGNDVKEKTISASQAGKELLVIFSGVLVAANVDNTVEISYIVTRANGTDQRSPVLKLLVAAALSNLPKPTVAGVTPTNTLIPENVPDSGVLVSVPRYTGIDGKDSIIVKWAANPSHVTTPQLAGDAGDISFTLPKSVAVDNAGNSASVTYAVTRGSAPSVESAVTTFDVQALAPPLSIGADHALALNGYVVFQGRPPATPPANAIYTRAATGGQPPYAYQSSTVNVALIDADGKVTASGNGVTTITATDTLGATASYQLKTSGARVFVGFKNVRKSFYDYRTFCDQQGVHSMNANDFKQLRAVYVAENSSVGHLLGWGNGWGWWTNEQVSSGSLGNSRSFNLDSGSVDLVSNNFQLNCFGIKK